MAPAELEALLLEHPKVADCGVVGIADERAGELPRAYIVKKANVSLSDKEIHEYVNGKMLLSVIFSCCVILNVLGRKVAHGR